MKKILIVLLTACFFFSSHSNAQNKTLKKVLELKMPKTTEDEMCGTRGGSVCWNPLTQKYYASFAGNKGFPMAVFDTKGKRLSTTDLITQADTRGLWYDPARKKICGNGYHETGWFSYTLDTKGIPTDVLIDHEGMNQPGENSAGTYNPVKKEVIFLNNELVSFYKNDATNTENTLTLSFGAKKSEGKSGEQESDNSVSEYNNTSVLFTGIPGSELGVLNTTKKQVELYSYSNGSLGKIFMLPDDTPVEKSFNFAYANGIYWLFDIENRKWLGFK